jgi:hypothetical protein
VDIDETAIENQRVLFKGISYDIKKIVGVDESLE